MGEAAVEARISMQVPPIPERSLWRPNFSNIAGITSIASVMRLLSGRNFTCHDEANSPPWAGNATFARRMLEILPLRQHFPVATEERVPRKLWLVGGREVYVLTEDAQPASFSFDQEVNSNQQCCCPLGIAPTEIAAALDRTLTSIDPNLRLHCIAGPMRLIWLYSRRAQQQRLFGIMGLLAAMLAITVYSAWPPIACFRNE